MIIISGTRSTFHSQTTDKEIPCAMCGSKNIHVVVYQRYHHIFFLPTFPIRKLLEVRCISCSAAQQDCATTELIAKHYPRKTNIKYWTGTFVILILAALLWLSMQNSDSIQRPHTPTQEDYLDKPEAGDIYAFRRASTGNESSQYLKIVNVTQDTIIVVKSKVFRTYHNDVKTFLDKNSHIFKGKPVPMHYAKLRDLYNEHYGVFIYRPETKAK